MLRRTLLFIFQLLLISCNNLQGQENQKAKYLLKDATLITAENNEVLQHATLLISGNRIQGIFHEDSLPGCVVDSIIDLSGKFIIPGLIDSHNHLSGREVSDQAIQNALRWGITGIRDMGGDVQYLRLLKNDISNELLTGPDIYYSTLVAGWKFISADKRAILSTPPEYPLGYAPGMRAVCDTTDLDQLMKESVQTGASGIKIYSHLSPPLIKRIAEKATQYQLKVWAHGIVPPSSLEEVIQSGVNSISHVGFFLMPDHWDLKRDGSLALDSTQLDIKRLEKLFRIMKQNQVSFDPTLTLSLNTAEIRIQDKKECDTYKKTVCNIVKEAYLHDILIIAGTDMFLRNEEGYIPEIHLEIRSYVKYADIPAYEAIKAATINGARVLGIESEYGSIKEGKIANLVILNSNPLINIENTTDIYGVIKNGKRI